MRRGSRAGLSLCGIDASSRVGDICEDSGCAEYDEGGPGIRLRSAAVVMSSLRLPLSTFKVQKYENRFVLKSRLSQQTRDLD